MVRVGKLAATHGLKGALILTHTLEKNNWLKKGEALFVAIRKGSHIPYFVSAVQSARHGELIIQLEDVVTMEEAKKLTGKEVFLKDIVLHETQTETPALWIGFTIFDKAAGKLGVIDDIYQVRNQWLAQFNYKGHEVLAPLVEQTLIKADMYKKELHVHLPEGLLEVYM